ncbi:glutathione synthetase [Streptomyces sp. NPDC055239]
MAVVVAPYGDDGAYASEFTARGWPSVAVELAPEALPPELAASPVSGEYRHRIVHNGSLRETAELLAPHRVGAVVAGSSLGVDLADQLAKRLRRTGNDPSSSLLRHDIGLQAEMLEAAGVAAPRGIRTKSLAAALDWAAFHDLPEYVVAAADTALEAPVRRCRSGYDLALAWRALRRTTHQQGPGPDLVLQEHLSGTVYHLDTVTGRGPYDTVEHRVTRIWAETQTPAGLHDRSDLVDPRGLVPRLLTLYMLRVLDILQVTTGALRSRLVLVDGQGPVLVRAEPGPPMDAADLVLRELTGNNFVQDVVRAALPDRPHAPTSDSSRPHVARVSLIAPQDGVLDQELLRTISTLPTVRQTVGDLRPGARVRRTVARSSSPGELVLAADSRADVDRDHRAVRAAERRGLYRRHR